ncbi:hypothetical protein AC249_AIPGENE4467 [Exaiptasia diaphana]|nr:hypothetical protein AC249_AIPGENE4467 [Exaiptasia diaphana]
MGNEESSRCRVCAIRLDPKNKQDVESNLCQKCRSQGAKALWENRDSIKSLMKGEVPGQKKKRQKGKKDPKQKKRRTRP